MKFKQMEIEKPFYLDLDGKNSFKIEELKVCGKNFLAKGIWSGESFPQKASLIGSCLFVFSEPSKMVVREWVIDTDSDEKVYNIEEIMELLNCKKDMAWRITKNILPPAEIDSRGKKYWNANDVLKIKPFLEKSKWELLQYIAKNI